MNTSPEAQHTKWMDGQVDTKQLRITPETTLVNTRKTPAVR
jgi:hypothetical protein